MFLVYIPLALTPLLNQLVRPIGSAALSRLPDPITALAVWPVITSFSWLLLTPSSALNEVVNALIDRHGSHKPLVRFITLVGFVETAVMVLIAATPLARTWFGKVSGLEPGAVQIASHAFWLLVPLGILAPLGAWFSGVILNTRKTRPITEGMLVYLGTFSLVLGGGSAFIKTSGLYLVTAASLSASICQIGWLWFRSRQARRSLA